MQLLFVYDADGWWPRISPDGNRVIFGGGGAPGVEPSIRIWTRSGPLGAVLSPAVPGRAGRFLTNGTATFVRPLDNVRATRLTLDTNGGNHAIAIPTADDPNLVGGNDFACGDGWASVRVSDMRLAVNNTVVPNVRARQVRAFGPHLLVTEGNNETFTIRPFGDPTTVLWTAAVPPSAHFASLGAQDIVAYGYESPFGVLNYPGGAIWDATALPWRRENNALVVAALDGTLWAFSSGQRLDTGAGLVIGRPLTSTNVFEVPFDASGGLDVRAVAGGFLVAGCSAVGVLEVWLVPYNAARGPVRVQRPVEPVGRAITGYTGYFFDHGAGGDFTLPCNCTILGRGMYEDGDGHRPPDVDDRVVRAAEQAGAIFLAVDDIEALAPRIWERTHGVWFHEPSDPETAKAQTAAAHALMDRLKLARRPVIAVLSTATALDPAFAEVADWLAVEIYHAHPRSTWAEQVEATAELITHIDRDGVGISERPTLLVVQAYDRNGDPRWMASPLLLEAIQYACQQAVVYFKGLLWFSGPARKGGTGDYPALAEWHLKQVQVTTRPTLPKPPVPPDPPNPEDDMFYPNDAQCTNMLQRISDAFINILKRVPPPEAPHSGVGIYRVPPDGLEWAIPDTSRDAQAAGGPVRIDTRALAVWLGRYFHLFNEFQADHEKAANAVLDAIRTSPEGQAANPQ